MAFEKGTASSHKDLLTKLITFLTTSTELVAVSQQYEVVFDKTMPFTGQSAVQPDRRHVVLKGRGLSGNDQIFSSISEIADTASDFYNWALGGGTGFIESSLPPGYGDLRSGMVGGNLKEKCMLFWDQPMTYWFFANGRRWYVVAKVSTTYTAGGAGFILPPCPPTEYRYPMAVWGSADSRSARWSTTSGDNFGMTCGTCQLRDPGGAWGDHRGRHGSGSGLLMLPTGVTGYIYHTPSGTNTGGNWSTDTYDRFLAMRDGPDGSFPLWPITLVTTPTGSSSTQMQNIYGEADGLFWVPSLNNGAEDEVQIGGETYILFQSVFRAENPYLFAIRK